jgi:Tfp pilus assembly protein PilF
MPMFDQIFPLMISVPRAAVCVGLLMVMSGCCATNGWVMNNSGMGYYHKGNYSMARGEFERAVMDSPRSPDFRHNLAMAMQKQGDVQQAETVLRHNLSVDPAHQPTYHALTQILISQQRIDEADHLLAGWRQSQPYSPEAYVEQAWFQRETGNLAAAEQTLQQALQVKPNHPAALAQLGQLRQETGQTTEAASYYQRSLQARWNQPAVRSRLAAINGTGPANLRRSALMQNSGTVQTVSMNHVPLDGGQSMIVQNGIPAESMGFADPVLHGHAHTHGHAHGHRHDHGRRASRKQLTAYPLPDFGMADAGGWQGGMITSPSPIVGSTMTESTMIASPTLLPEMSAAQPTFAVPETAATPTPILQADPAHATEMSAGLPVVEPY